MKKSKPVTKEACWTCYEIYNEGEGERGPPIFIKTKRANGTDISQTQAAELASDVLDEREIRDGDLGVEDLPDRRFVEVTSNGAPDARYFVRCKVVREYDAREVFDA